MGESDGDGISRARAVRRTGVYFCLFTVLGLIGRTALSTDGRTALIWPAAGIAALWLGTSSGRRRIADVVGLVVATVLVNALTGAAATLIPALVAANLAGALVFAVWGRTTAGHLWGVGGNEPLSRLADLGHLVGASVLSGLAAAVIGWFGLFIDQGAGATDLLVWWCRCSIGTLVVASFGILVFQPVVTRGLVPWLRSSALDFRGAPASRFVEAAALVLATALVTGLVLYEAQLDSLVYLLILGSVWAGLRFAPVLAMAHAMALGWTMLLAANIGTGPFAADDHSETARAMLAQGFLAVVALTALVLALARWDLTRTSLELAAALEDVSARTTLLDTVLRTMREGLTVVDEDGQVVLSNPSSAVLLGLPPDEPAVATADRAIGGLFHADGRPVAPEDLPGYRALDGEEVPPSDFHVRSPDLAHGRVVEIAAHLLPAGEPNGPRRVVVNIRDVTADRQHRDALANFAGTVAHDLFTPLTMINGWSETLVESFEDGEVDPEVGLTAARRIHSSAQHMRDVIRDLLAYAVARDQSLRLTTVDLSSLVEQLAGLSRSGKAAPVIRVQEGIVVRGDPVLLRQLFENLLANAVKYAAPGVRPAVSVSALRTGETIEIRVTDNGIGISPADREHVFAPYHRVDETGRGTGLGLAICRRIVDRHGGRITIEDGPDGRGTTVLIRLAAVDRVGRGGRRGPRRRTAGPASGGAGPRSRI